MFEAFFTTFFALPLWICCIYGLGLCGMFALVDTKYPFGNLFLTLVALIGLQYTHVIDFTQAPHHIGEIAAYFGIYLGIGLLWSMVKWYFYTKNWVRDIKTNADAYTKVYENDLSVLYNLGRITNWLLYWPISMIWTLIADALKSLGEWLIYDVFGKIYGAMSLSATKQAKEHVEALRKIEDERLDKEKEKSNTVAAAADKSKTLQSSENGPMIRYGTNGMSIDNPNPHYSGGINPQNPNRR